MLTFSVHGLVLSALKSNKHTSSYKKSSKKLQPVLCQHRRKVIPPRHEVCIEGYSWFFCGMLTSEKKSQKICLFAVLETKIRRHNANSHTICWCLQSNPSRSTIDIYWLWLTVTLRVELRKIADFSFCGNAKTVSTVHNDAYLYLFLMFQQLK